MLLLLGCAARNGGEAQGPGEVVAGGGVVADEPQAAIVGRDTLAAGGSAADAAVAMYFTLAVTLPSRASLGGGGVCAVFDPNTGETQALEFLARPPSAVPPEADRPTAVPGNVRGFYALHARGGRLRWSQVLVAAENLARFGTRVSRAFANDLHQVSDALKMQSEARRTFAAANKRDVVEEGDLLAQNDLATVLARIRTEGPADFYTGAIAQTLVKAAHEAGGSLERADLQSYQPVWRKTIAVESDGRAAYFPPPPPAAGAVAAEMWSMLLDQDRYKRGDAHDRPHLLAETAVRALGDRVRWQSRAEGEGFDAQSLVARDHIEGLMASYRANAHSSPEQIGLPAQASPENPAAASFIAVDSKGSAVACAVTPNSLFGTGRVAPGTGIVLASMPGAGGRGAMALGPMIVTSGKEFIFAASASGGQVAPTAMVEVAASALLAKAPLGDAVAAKRVHASSVPDMVFTEQGEEPSVARSLKDRGHRVAITPALGRVSAILCPDGSPQNPASCAFAADPRGFGLAARVD